VFEKFRKIGRSPQPHNFERLEKYAPALSFALTRFLELHPGTARQFFQNGKSVKNGFHVLGCGGVMGQNFKNLRITITLCPSPSRTPLKNPESACP
jgi:hypothetical protein